MKTKSLTIATYNINKDGGDFPKRIYALRDAMCHLDADILALQEDYSSKDFSSSEIINQSLKFHTNTLPTRLKRRGSVMSSSNLTLLSRYKAVSLGYIIFNETVNEQRAALFNTYVIDNKRLLMANTHLCHISEENRLFQINAILKHIDKTNIKNVILCGDFNADRDSKVIGAIIDSGYHFKGVSKTLPNGREIDFIFARGDITLKESATSFEEFSDHLCLITTAEFCNA